MQSGRLTTADAKGKESMDEPVKVKYVPVDAVKNFIKGHYWLTSDFDELVDIYGIDVVHYKCNVTLSEREASMFEGNADFTAESFVKKRAAEWLSEKLEDHIKCTSVERLPVANARGYRYDVMIGEIPKWQQKGEADASNNN